MAAVAIDYERIIPRRIAGMPPSGIRKFFDLLDGMTDVTALTVGQPDFVTPWHIREAGIESLEKGKTYYIYNNGRTDDSFSLIVLYYTFTHTVLLCNITVYQRVIGGVKADTVPVEAPKKANSMPTVLN